MHSAQGNLCGDAARQSAGIQLDYFIQAPETGMYFMAALPRKHSWRGTAVNMANYYAVRLHYNNEILPGKMKNNNAKTVSLVNGVTRIKQVADSKMEFIVVNDACSLTWVSYVAGNQMPQRAVVGGERAGGEPLFVASLWTTKTDMVSRYSYGYYDTKSLLGYAYNGGQPRSNSSVDIMVEIWDTGQIYRVLMEEQYGQS